MNRGGGVRLETTEALPHAVRDGARVITYEAPANRNPLPSRRYYFWLMAPALILLAAISLYPFFWLIYMMLHEVQLAPNAPDAWVGLKNFTQLLNDKKFLNGWMILFRYSAFCLILEVGIGLMLALMLNNAKWEKVLVTVFL